MNLAYTMQKFQDWFTQQWVILMGRKINPKDFAWLIGPFGELNGIGELFINQLAEKENLIIQRNSNSQGLVSSIDKFNLTDTELNYLSKKVIDFYENTANYDLYFTVKWNPFFIIFGLLVNRLFSQRINQLNIPTSNIKDSESLSSEIITLFDSKSNEVKYTIWLRTLKSSGKIIYSGIYEVCELPSGKACIKAIFPLPKGNATVIMEPSVGAKGELILNSSGKKIGDSGFYFLLNDSKGNFWTHYIRSFRDTLIVYEQNNCLFAKQVLTLWNQKVLELNYKINNIKL
jgi:hypothetical protein